MARQAPSLLLALMLVFLGDTSPASGAERRIALVIGNGKYREAPLRNTTNDAGDMAAVLRRTGFEVILAIDATQKEMNRAIASFGDRLTPDTVALFYYAGHGMQLRGKNYLIPIDAEIRSEASVRVESVDVDAVLDQLSTSEMNVVILDACRNNPFERRSRSSGAAGLAQMEAPKGTMIAYATAPGRTAADGENRNGLYTRELLKQIEVQGLALEQVFKNVRRAVAKATRDAQIPWESSSMTGDFYFVPGPPLLAAVASQVTATAAGQPASLPMPVPSNWSPAGSTLAATDKLALAMPATLPYRQPPEQPVTPARIEGPSGKPLAAVDKPDLQVGDQWTYRTVDLWKNEESTQFEFVVTQAKGDSLKLERTIIAPATATDVGIPSTRTADRSTWTFASRNTIEGKYVTFAFPLEPGKTWEFEYSTKSANGDVVVHKRTARAETWEDVEVPAGKFHALKVIHSGTYTRRARTGSFSGNVSEIFWYAPEVKRFIKREFRDTVGHARTHDQVREELMAYRVR
jgi:hypothetical protein